MPREATVHFELYRYIANALADEPDVTNLGYVSVEPEYNVNGGFADIVVFDTRGAKLVIEAKREEAGRYRRDIDPYAPKVIEQAFSYAGRLGADILAHFSIASTFEVQVAVQAKHYLAKPPVPAEVVDDLVQGMGAANTTFGWVVTSGNISDEATKRADELHEQEGLSIHLVDGEQLAAMLIETAL